VNSKPATYQVLQVVVIIFLMACFSSCSMEKRLYRPGWHVEWPKINSGENSVPTKNSEINEVVVPPKMAESIVPSGLRTDSTFASDKAEPISVLEVTPKRITNNAKTTQEAKIDESVTIRGNGVGHKQMHPHAGLSFVMGAIAMGCVLAPILVSGLGTVVILCLAVALLVTALLAFKWSRMALEDIHMARNRYSGKALAAAGLVLAVLSLVALIGVVVIALLGAAFLSFT
jgi:hypothetical protein